MAAVQTTGRVDPAPDSDSALVAAALRQDGAACRAIWRRYSPLVLRLVRRFFGSSADYPDVCQEVFLRIFKRLRELRDSEALRGFVIGICLGVARNELRRHKIRALVGLAPDFELQPAPGIDEDSREAARRLYVVLDGLRTEERSLFITRYVERMELTEVAAVHGLSLATARRRIARMTTRVSARMRSDPVLSSYVDGLTRVAK